ncbi:MAG: flippase-like domain-containing protein, partial [Spirochaetes bacterium]|nr:flippase-like domain-containing protein [Spirochaetota bacterium]
IFLDLTFHKIDFTLFFQNFRYINFFYFMLIVLIMYVTLFLRSFKWKFLLEPVKKVRLGSLFKSTLVGYMGNAIFPARIGELLRAFIVNKFEKISKVTALSTIVLERIFDGLMVGSLFVSILLFNPLHNKTFLQAGISALVMYTLFILILILFYFRYKWVQALIKRFFDLFKLKYKDKILKATGSFYEGLHIFKSRKDLLVFTLLTIMIWIMYIIQTYFFCKAMNIFHTVLADPGYSVLFTSILLTFVMAIGIAIPSGPGAAGPLHASIVFTFILLNPQLIHQKINYNYVASFSMFIWLTQIIPVTIGGLAVMVKENVKIKEIK